MSDTIKHSPELAAACQYVNDLKIKKALQESSMSVLLTEEFSSREFNQLVKSIADVSKLLPAEMSNSVKSFQDAVKSALTTKAKLNRGSVTKEEFAKEVAQLAGLGSALTSVVADLKNIALLRDATSRQQEADGDDRPLGDVLDDDEQDLVKSAIEDSFEPDESWLPSFLLKNKKWYGLSVDGLFDDLMNVTLNGLGKLMQSKEIPNAFKEAMSSEEGEEIAVELESGSKDEDEEEEAVPDKKPGTRKTVSWDEFSKSMKSQDETLTDNQEQAVLKAFEEQGIKIESAHSGKDKIILERWRKMAGICKDRE